MQIQITVEVNNFNPKAYTKFKVSTRYICLRILRLNNSFFKNYLVFSVSN